MSLSEYRDTVADGDNVILFLGYNNMLQIKVQSGQTHQTRYGALKHRDLVGARYGSKVQCTKGYVYVLHLTPELWTVNLPHRTQILYSTDISMISMQLELKPGSVVVESGTGSGSLSHSIMRTIAPSGHLHTFEFHAERAHKARQEFADHGFGDLVTVTHRDVCEEGFGLNAQADAVFLDLPSPWNAIETSKQALKSGGRLCSFSPCIEQVQRVCEKLTASGFTDIKTMECLLRTFDILNNKLPYADLGDVAENLNIQENDKDSSGEMISAKKLKKDVTEKNLIQKSTPDGSSSKTHNKESQITEETCVYKAAIPIPQMPGHTGYLTFATLYLV